MDTSDKASVELTSRQSNENKELIQEKVDPDQSQKEEEDSVVVKSDPTTCQMVKNIVKLAAPSTFSVFLETVMEVINTIFIG